MSEHRITIRVNGRVMSGHAEARVTLVDFLRDVLGLTGTHVGCEHGVCGACTILFDGESARSCLMFAVQTDGHSITTVEGLTPDQDNLHPLQQSFWEAHGLQCGYCTPGMILSALEIVRRFGRPTEREVREALDGNLCRCTGYQGIVEAVLDGAAAMEQERNA